MGEEGLRAAAAAGFAALLLGGCAVTPAPTARPAAPPAPVFTAPQLAPIPTPPPPTAPAPPRDTCGLATLAELVGKPRTDIPVPVDLSRRRVVCEGCPVTLDVRPDRQTIWYDQATSRVTRVQCG